jgi:retron-type reverse transcriptase
MMWKEGLLIKLYIMGFGGRVFNWLKDFLFGRPIKVRMGNSKSESYEVDNGTPQGSFISILLFSIMIDNVFSQVRRYIDRSLFAEDGAL